MCQTVTRPFLWGISDDKTIVWTRPDCKMWSCRDCAQTNRKKWVKRVAQGVETYIQAGEFFYFMTVTSHEDLKTFEATVKVFPDAWRKLYARMKRINPALHYVVLPEQHKDGRLHVHSIINEGFGCVDKDHQGHWLKDNARQCGLGYIADIQPLESVAGAAWYTAKYIGKSLGVDHWPKHLRRIRVSNNWPELKDDVEFDRLNISYRVVLDELRFDYEMKEWAAAGYRVIYLRTGEVSHAGAG